MTSFRRRLGERCADVLDWIDYRRDASFWPFFVLPPMLSVTWAYGGWIGLGLVVAFALGVTLLVGLLTGLAALGWIVVNATLDVASLWRPRILLAPSTGKNGSMPSRRIPA